jgi:hypothetical protein
VKKYFQVVDLSTGLSEGLFETPMEALRKCHSLSLLHNKEIVTVDGRVSFPGYEVRDTRGNRLFDEVGYLSSGGRVYRSYHDAYVFDRYGAQVTVLHNNKSASFVWAQVDAYVRRHVEMRLGLVVEHYLLDTDAVAAALAWSRAVLHNPALAVEGDDGIRLPDNAVTPLGKRGQKRGVFVKQADGRLLWVDVAYPKERVGIGAYIKTTKAGTLRVAKKFADKGEAKAAGYQRWFSEGGFDIWKHKPSEHEAAWSNYSLRQGALLIGVSFAEE